MKMKQQPKSKKTQKQRQQKSLILLVNKKIDFPIQHKKTPQKKETENP